MVPMEFVKTKIRLFNSAELYYIMVFRSYLANSSSNSLATSMNIISYFYLFNVCLFVRYKAFTKNEILYSHTIHKQMA